MAEQQTGDCEKCADIAPIDAETYTREAHKFATYGGNIMYPALGLGEEAGEALGKMAKWIRKHGGSADGIDEDPALRSDMKKELGDCAWMMNELIMRFGLTWGEVMAYNVAKLADRKSRGVIIGSGDDR